MGQVLHGSASTTAAIRRAIQNSQESLRVLAKRHGINPIEKAFAKPKAMLRKAEEHIVNGLWDLIGKLVDIFQPKECANYSSSCGYDLE